MSEWISVKDRLPEGAEKVVAYLHFPSGGDVMDMAYYMGDAGWYYASWEAPHHGCVTHWMPLPPPPVSADDKMQENAEEKMSESGGEEEKKIDSQ